MPNDPVRLVTEAARRAARSADAPLLLGVSGGLDSIALLHAMASAAPRRIAAVATMDHGTGPAATAAAAHVARTASALGLPVVIERLPRGTHGPNGREAAWRRERYRFLRSIADSLGARVVTAHTEDDQVETVLMRVLRGSGARGLAGLLAPSDVLRPFLSIRRRVLASYAAGIGATWCDDPTNRSPAFLRNRVRRDLLPALRRADPEIDAALLDIGRRAAAWRAGVEAFVDAQLRPRHREAQALIVDAEELTGYDEDSLGVLWSALAGRLGLALNRRGTRRLAAFTMAGPHRGSVPLSGGWCVEAERGAFVLRRSPVQGAAPATLPEHGAVRWGGFTFRVAAGNEVPATDVDSDWRATLPLDTRSVVRRWAAGDRLAPTSGGGRPPRRVKRYLSDAGVRGVDRASWPVVLTGNDVVWIPGVCRSDAATERSGRPARYYVCERIDR